MGSALFTDGHERGRLHQGFVNVTVGESPLNRSQREMIAIVTSQANACDY